MRISDWSSDVCSSDLFPMFEKIDVNGPFAHPLYQWLVEQAPGILGSRAVKWNLTKFLMDRTGNPVVRYPPTMEPKNILPAIQRTPEIERDAFRERGGQYVRTWGGA